MYANFLYLFTFYIHPEVVHGSSFADPIQSSPWMDPIHVQVLSTDAIYLGIISLHKQKPCARESSTVYISNVNWVVSETLTAASPHILDPDLFRGRNVLPLFIHDGQCVVT